MFEKGLRRALRLRGICLEQKGNAEEALTA